MKALLAAIITLAATATAAPCRFIATWGGPLVQWHEPATGHRWTCSYAEFFAHCGKRHPREMGIKVLGSLPSASQQQPAPAPARPPAPQIVAKKTSKPKPQSREQIGLPLPPADFTAAHASHSALLLPPAMPESATIQEVCRSMYTGLLPERGQGIEITPEPEARPESYNIVSLLAEDIPSDSPADLVQMVKNFEGFKPRKYWDHSQWSIGYGTLAKPGDGTITREEAESRLRAALAQAAAEVDAAAAGKGIVLTGKQRDALTSFHYNTGAIARVFQRSEGDAGAIPDIIQEWRRAGGKVQPGLVTRRRTEAKLYASNP